MMGGTRHPILKYCAGHVQVSASNAGRGGVLLMLNASSYEQLKVIIRNEDDV
jgi:hypothetical protein